jgi:hypothetical protein
MLPALPHTQPCQSKKGDHRALCLLRHNDTQQVSLHILSARTSRIGVLQAQNVLSLLDVRKSPLQPLPACTSRQKAQLGQVTPASKRRQLSL